jgi:hypothetical protein
MTFGNDGDGRTTNGDSGVRSARKVYFVSRVWE